MGAQSEGAIGFIHQFAKNTEAVTEQIGKGKTGQCYLAEGRLGGGEARVQLFHALFELPVPGNLRHIISLRITARRFGLQDIEGILQATGKILVSSDEYTPDMVLMVAL